MKKSKLMLTPITSTLTINNHLNEFIINCKARNLAPRTIKYYEEAFNRFIATMDILSLSEILPQTIDHYVLHLLETANVYTVNSNLRGVRRVLYYFMSLSYMDTFKVILMKQPEPIKETYTDAELKLLLKKVIINEETTFIEYRNWVIINFLLGTGCRLETLINIKINDLDLDNTIVKFITTKNKKGILVPVSNTLTTVLQEYLKYRSYNNTNDFLFCNSFGEKVHKRTLQQSIKDYNLARGINKSSIHMFRHTFAKKWILNGGDMFRLQKILGHSDLDMVRKYVNMFNDDLKIDFNEINPLESISSNKSHIKLKIKQSL